MLKICLRWSLNIHFKPESAEAVENSQKCAIVEPLKWSIYHLHDDEARHSLYCRDTKTNTLGKKSKNNVKEIWKK